MNRIKELRQKNKLSQIELANKIKASNQAISAYENGSREPKEPTWQALANFFNVSVDYLKGAYSKEEIAKIAQQTYKEDYYQNSSDLKIRAFSTICDDYFVSIGVVPVDIKKKWKLIPPEKVESLEFWKNILEELYIPYVAIRWLIEKPSLNASKNDVIDAVKGAMAAYTYSSDKYDERCIFLAKHTFYRKQVETNQVPEYTDFNREHPLDNQIYY